MRFRRDPLFEIEAALSAKEGLEKARSFRPDVVLVDVVMPSTDGWEFCRRLKADPAGKNARIVAMTAQAGAADAGRVREAGVHSVLTKPFDLAGLAGALAAAAR